MKDHMEQISVKQIRAEENGEVFDATAEKPDIDARLTSIVEGMFERCLAEKEFKQAMGMAIESMRLDVIERVVASSSQEKELLQYCYEVCLLELLANLRFIDLHELGCKQIVQAENLEAVSRPLS